MRSIWKIFFTCTAGFPPQKGQSDGSGSSTLTVIAVLGRRLRRGLRGKRAGERDQGECRDGECGRHEPVSPGSKRRSKAPGSQATRASASVHRPPFVGRRAAPRPRQRGPEARAGPIAYTPRREPPSPCRRKSARWLPRVGEREPPRVFSASGSSAWGSPPARGRRPSPTGRPRPGGHAGARRGRDRRRRARRS